MGKKVLGERLFMIRRVLISGMGLILTICSVTLMMRATEKVEQVSDRVIEKGVQEEVLEGASDSVASGEIEESLALDTLDQVAELSASDEDLQVSIPIESDEEYLSNPITSQVMNNYNDVVEALGVTMNQNHLAALIYSPTWDQLETVHQLGISEYREELWDTRIIVVPQYIDSMVTVYQLNFNGDDLVEDEVLLQTQITDSNRAVVLNCYVPCGIPNLKIVVDYQGKHVEYIVTEDGIENVVGTKLL